MSWVFLRKKLWQCSQIQFDSSLVRAHRMCNGERIENPFQSVIIFKNLKRDEKNYFENSENHQSPMKATQCTHMHSHQEATLTLPMPVHYDNLVPSLSHCDSCFYAALHTQDPECPEDRMGSVGRNKGTHTLKSTVRYIYSIFGH